MKTVCRSIVVALLFAGPLANAHAEEPVEEPLRMFLPECDSYIDDCRAYMNEFILSGIKLSNNPEPACVPIERNKAADMMIAHLHNLVREPYWAEEPYGNALMQAMTDAFPCLTDY